MTEKEFQAYQKRLYAIYERGFRLDREFISCLQKPECRSRKLHFLIDVDDLSKLNEVEEQIERLNIEVVHKTRTKINFETPTGKGSGAWFPVAWFCWKILPKQIVFGSVGEK